MILKHQQCEWGKMILVTRTMDWESATWVIDIISLLFVEYLCGMIWAAQQMLYW